MISSTANKLRDLVDSKFQVLFTYKSNPPSEFISKMYERYLALPRNYQSNSMNGSIFELIIAVVLYRSKINPLYQQVSLTYVPHAIFDIIAFTDDGSLVCLSLKTSFRERWKQADLEASALKMVHRRAKCILVSYDIKDAINVQNKINSSETFGLDQPVSSKHPAFDALVTNQQKTTFAHPTNVPVISKSLLCSK